MQDFNVMLKLFPMFQSYLPGGLKYDLTKPMADRIKLAVRAAGILLTAAKDAGTNRWGSPGRADNYTPIGLLQRYTEHGTMREDRRRWQAACKKYRVWSATEEWAVGVTPQDNKNWYEFRLALREYIAKVEGKWVDPQPGYTEDHLIVVATEIVDTKKPDHQYYMTVLFPFWMAHTPGGLHYDMSVGIDERVDRWVIQTRILGDTADALGIALSGGLKGPDHPGISFAKNVENFSISVNIRKVRNSWKRGMDYIGADRTDPTWRRADGRDASLIPEWELFRENLKARYSHLFT